MVKYDTKTRDKIKNEEIRNKLNVGLMYIPWMKIIGYETAISDICLWQQRTK